MKQLTRRLAAAMTIVMLATLAPQFVRNASAAEPDYRAWTTLLAKYYDPVKGMDYRGLKAKDRATLNKLRSDMSRVHVAALSRNEQLAYWMNLYNISAVATVVDAYPVDSIRDISTDPIVRLNVFKKETVPLGKTKVSLDWIEHEKVRKFEDARIHFAINCAAKSCPPMRREAFVGARVGQQLDEQARTFLNGPYGARLERDGEVVILRTTKIMDWFGDDFKNWSGGVVAFAQRYLSADKQKMLPLGTRVRVEFDDYDWSLNDWKR
jgi:hypothetical protein